MAGVTDRSPLAQLVDEVCQANGWSRREVARRAQAHGRTLSPSRLGQLVTEYPLGGIQADKIDDLAIGLGISRDRVAVAVVQAMGFRIQDTSISVAEAIRRDTSLPQATKDALLAILRTATKPARRPGGGEHDQRSAPITTERDVYVASGPDAAYAGATGGVDELRARLRQRLEAAVDDRERAEVQALLDRLEQVAAEPPADSGFRSA